MLKIVASNQFKKDLKLARKRGLKLDHLTAVVNTLASEESLDKKYRDHALSGNYKNYRECHIKPDLLLIYKIEKTELVLYAVHIGSHSDLFK